MPTRACRLRSSTSTGSRPSSCNSGRRGRCKGLVPRRPHRRLRDSPPRRVPSKPPRLRTTHRRRRGASPRGTDYVADAVATRVDQPSEAGEYDPGMQTLLQLLWGEGFLSPGGAAEVAYLLEGSSIAGCSVLDIGCGLGAV